MTALQILIYQQRFPGNGCAIVFFSSRVVAPGFKGAKGRKTWGKRSELARRTGRAGRIRGDRKRVQESGPGRQLLINHRT